MNKRPMWQWAFVGTGGVALEMCDRQFVDATFDRMKGGGFAARAIVHDTVGPQRATACGGS